MAELSWKFWILTNLKILWQQYKYKIGDQNVWKHTAAIWMYSNFGNRCSKTNQPMIGNKPPMNKQLNIKKLLNLKNEKSPFTKCTVDAIENVSSLHLTKKYPMIKMVNVEKKCNALTLRREMKKKT